MLNPQFILPISTELVVDLFAGGGGASTGIELAIGRHVDIAINHDPEAISLHEANHPQTRHFVSDVFEVDPLTVCADQPIGLLWASPDCTFHSKARGGKPFRDRNKARRRRGLATVVTKWVRILKPTNQHPRVICLENVEEFQHWGPLLEDGTPCPDRRGTSFQRWVAQLRNLGYVVDWRELRACDYGAPTIRKRLFLVARCDGQPIVWPTPTHGKPDSLPVQQKRLKPWRTAADCIDWSIPAPSIFERSKPLADATCRRIAKGIMRYVVNAEKPFVVNAAACTMVQTGYGEREGQAPRALDLGKPLGTVVAAQKHALVQAFLAKHYTGVVGSDLNDPVGTVTTVDHHSLVTANLVHMGHGEGKDGTKRFSHGIRSVTEPLNTVTASGAAAGLVTAHLVTIDNKSSQGGYSAATEPLKTIVTENRHALVRAFLIKYYGTDGDPSLTEPMHTVTTKDRFGLVTIQGTEYAIVDIGLRMLTPRELYRAQGFPEAYAIDKGADGHHMTKTAQVRMCGNSVCPPLSMALVSANYTELQAMRAAA